MSYATIIRDLANKVDESPEGRVDDIMFLHTYLHLSSAKHNRALSRGAKTTLSMNTTERHIKNSGEVSVYSELIIENSRFKVVVSIHDKDGTILERGFNLHVELLKKDKYWYDWFTNHDCQKWGDKVDVIIDDLDALIDTLESVLLGDSDGLFALVNVALDGGTTMDMSEKYDVPYIFNYVGTYAYGTEKGEMDLTKMSDIELRIFNLMKNDWWHGRHLDSEHLLMAKQTVIKYGEKACREASDEDLKEMCAHTISTDYEWRYGLGHKARPVSTKQF